MITELGCWIGTEVVYHTTVFTIALSVHSVKRYLEDIFMMTHSYNVMEKCINSDLKYTTSKRWGGTVISYTLPNYHRLKKVIYLQPLFVLAQAKASSASSTCVKE